LRPDKSAEDIDTLETVRRLVEATEGTPESEKAMKAADVEQM